MRCGLLLTLAACGRLGFDAGDDAASPDAVVPVTCGSTIVLTDDFADMTPAPLFTSYTSNGMTTSESAGAVSFVFAPNVGAGRYAGYDSATMYAAQDMCASVEVTAIPTSEGLGYFHLFGSTQKIEFISYRGSIELRTVESSTPTSVGVFTFDPVAHRFWRLRHQAGVTYWDVSADGAMYTQLAAKTFFTVAAAQFSIGAGAVMTTTDSGRFTVEQMTITQP